MAERPTQPEDPTEPIVVPPRPPLPGDEQVIPPKPPLPGPGPGPEPHEPAAEPEATTLPLPVVGAPQPGYPQTAAYAHQGYPETAAYPQAAASTPPPAKQQKPKKKHRAVTALVTTLVIVAVLAGAGVVGWFAGNSWLKNKVVAEVTEQTRTALDLDPRAEVDVDVDEPMIPQVVSGRLSALTVTVPEAPLGGATGKLTVHATDVPTSGDGAVGSADATVSLTPDALTKLIGNFDDTVAGSLKVDDGNVVVDLNPAQFLSGISFALTFTPSAKDGELVLTPEKFTVGGLNMSADTIRARFGSLADGILADRTVCVADQFPKGLKLSKIDVGSDSVDASFTVDPNMLSDASLQKPGTCG
ncbi:DUF2993 domain-containing protein [Microbacterium horticulturae]|uniref:DUF2993 domain-containing protein n=1 Tax=Microbacterium horticulturae TaxID=3028316 RepID=A0ABY8BZG4_9MICO|nr:DUF2993 domain-containing protein [Microbacterium sp. KACC 23027]WEG07803.1 DUF2993 domain-containing protein [Microbacterium sp. KACC 23027]